MLRVAVGIETGLRRLPVEGKEGNAAGRWRDDWTETDWVLEEGARVKEVAAEITTAGVIKKDAVVRGRSARTGLTDNDLVVEPELRAGRFWGLSEEVEAASVGAVECVSGPRAEARGGTTLAFH